MNIKISVLKMFIAVVEAGNIHDAAEKVGRSASAVSTALKLLEEEVGGTLFETDRKNQLTPLGQYLYDTSLIQVGGYEKALLNVQAFAKGHLGQVQVASIPSVATSLMPKALKEFKKEYPHVDIELWDMDTATIARWVEQGKLDFGIGGIPNNPKVEFDPIYDDELVLVFPKSFPINIPDDSIDIRSLFSFPCITNGIIATSTDEMLQEFHNASRMNVHNTSSILALVAAGVGLTVLPRLSVAMDIPGIDICKVNLTENTRPVGLITNPTRPATPVSDLFLTHFKNQTQSKT
ncbi:LysR family transcriptional regulator [Curvivirga aplysinae]|uniref:LysR family transcriptional regulator n=1 Tax=Curvivirga aplysinae TaxID=2529852 RepID=UPI0012BBB52D|nr:LysR family transcriptional regulator [Curvivirga aplysinae]MTI10383.1 LysR family transcriptional regulator [Curvivirga aplysinae]